MTDDAPYVGWIHVYAVVDRATEEQIVMLFWTEADALAEAARRGPAWTVKKEPVFGKEVPDHRQI